MSSPYPCYWIISSKPLNTSAGRLPDPLLNDQPDEVLTEFHEEVNAAMKEGWVLNGPPQFSDSRIHQPMVRNHPDVPVEEYRTHNICEDGEMTQLEEFCAMLDTAGHSYEISENDRLVYRGYPNTEVSVPTTLVVVDGHFYDHLYAYFDKVGKLIEMISHVAYGLPGSKRAAELLVSKYEEKPDD